MVCVGVVVLQQAHWFVAEGFVALVLVRVCSAGLFVYGGPLYVDVRALGWLHDVV